MMTQRLECYVMRDMRTNSFQGGHHSETGLNPAFLYASISALGAYSETDDVSGAGCFVNTITRPGGITQTVNRPQFQDSNIESIDYSVGGNSANIWGTYLLLGFQKVTLTVD